MEPEKCKKWCFLPYISCRWNGHPGIAARDGNCILITGLMVLVLHQMEGSFLEKETHSLPLSICPLMVVNKTRQETKVMRSHSDPMDFILLLDLSVQSDLESCGKRCSSCRHFNKWRRKDEIGEKEKFFFPFLFLYHYCGYFSPTKHFHFHYTS